MSRIEELERRVRQDPASIAFGALAEEYRRAGRLEEAVAACRTGLARHPSYLSARVTLGRALQELGQLAAARAEFEYVLSLAPDNLAAMRALAELPADAPPTRITPPVAPAPPPRSTAPVPIAPATMPPQPMREPAPPPTLRPSSAPEPDLSALDAALDNADAAGGSQRAAQIERLEIWLARIEELRRGEGGGFTS